MSEKSWIFFATARRIVSSSWGYGQDFRHDNELRGGVIRLDTADWTALEEIGRMYGVPDWDFNELVEKIADQSDPVLLYVHGHLTDFKKSIIEALRIRENLRFKGSVVVFSWPTGTDKVPTAAYSTSKRNLGNSVAHLKKLVQSLHTAVSPPGSEHYLTMGNCC